jgi:D-beta-D-heptose 7-phosphate kinase/D-beta-D-heptose 1-phosphate adenosyltransferase
MNERELLSVLGRLGRPRVLIVGDLILDRYVTGDVARISPEAPIPVLAARSSQTQLGGAGNVAANLRAMEAEVDLFGVIGEDERGERLLELLASIGIDRANVVSCADRPTTEKTRMVSGVQQILRVDWEEVRPIGDASEARLFERLQGCLATADAVVLSDYGKGVLSPAFLRRTIEAGRARGIPVLVDPKVADWTRYRGATLVTPNRKEAEEALGRRIPSLEDLPRAAEELRARTGLDAVVITLGADGMYFRSAAGEGRIATVARAVFDVTGAGDTVIAHLALALADGRSLAEGVHLANHAAGIVVGRRGAAAVTREELRAALGERRTRAGAVLERSEIPALVAEWRAEGRRIVFTNGCFDILHAGHVAYLRAARARGDVLIVGLNDDASVRRLKGEGRPINPVGDRATVLAALAMVDAVVPFGEDTPEALVEEITPDVLVKGEDWEDKGVVGREWVESHGGEVFLAPLLPGRSTSAIARKLGGCSG